MLYALTLAALAAVTWCLWIRRWTWGTWHGAITAAVALAGTSIVLATSVMSLTLGRVLHSVTLEWHVEDLAAHLCGLAAVYCLAYATLGHIAADDTDFAGLLDRLRPAAYALPLMFASYTLTESRTNRHPNLLTAPADGWMAAYWCVYAATALYLLGHVLWALWIVRHEGIARVYLAAVVAAVMGTATALTNAATHASLGQLTGCLSSVVVLTLAVSAGVSWQARVATGAARDSLAA